MWASLEIDFFLGRTRSAEISRNPFLKILNVGNLLQITLHHVQVSRIDEYLFAISHSFQYLLIVLLLLDNLFFHAEILPLLSDTLLELVFDSELSQLLLKHQLVVLVAHVVLHLLLASLQFLHNLSVASFHGMLIVALP